VVSKVASHGVLFSHWLPVFYSKRCARSWIRKNVNNNIIPVIRLYVICAKFPSTHIFSIALPHALSENWREKKAVFSQSMRGEDITKPPSFSYRYLNFSHLLSTEAAPRQQELLYANSATNPLIIIFLVSSLSAWAEERNIQRNEVDTFHLKKSALESIAEYRLLETTYTSWQSTVLLLKLVNSIPKS